jgi:hypothetical protein
MCSSFVWQVTSQTISVVVALAIAGDYNARAAGTIELRICGHT